MQKTYKEKCFTSTIDNLNVHYLRDFLTPQKADKYYQILDKLLKDNSKNDKRTSITLGNTNICHIYEGTLCWNNDDITSQIIRVLRHQVEKFTSMKFNFVIINRYANGNVGIGAHRDKEKSLGDNPTIAGISLGSLRYVQFVANNFIPEEMPKKIQLALDHGSLYVMHDPTNKYWTHEILKSPKVYKSRISLTFRYLHIIE